MSDEQTSEQNKIVPSGSRGLTMRSLRLVRRGLDTLTKLPRIVRFPTDRPMGRLYLMNPHDESWDLHDVCSWMADYCPARGEIKVPANVELGLRVSKKGATDLSPIAQLNSNDLQAFNLSERDVTDAGLAYLQGLSGLKMLGLSWASKISDVGLTYLRNLTVLQSLYLDSTNVTDAGFMNLQWLTTLFSLDVSENEIGDVGLKNLQGLTSLQNLFLSNTRISDVGLQHLQGLSTLQMLSF